MIIPAGTHRWKVLKNKALHHFMVAECSLQSGATAVICQARFDASCSTLPLIALLLLQLQVGDNISVRDGQAGVNALLPRLALAEFVALRRQLGLSAGQQSRVHRLQPLGLLEDLLTPPRFWLSALRDRGF